MPAKVALDGDAKIIYVDVTLFFLGIQGRHQIPKSIYNSSHSFAEVTLKFQRFVQTQNMFAGPGII